MVANYDTIARYTHLTRKYLLQWVEEMRNAVVGSQGRTEVVPKTGSVHHSELAASEVVTPIEDIVGGTLINVHNHLNEVVLMSFNNLPDTVYIPVDTGILFQLGANGKVLNGSINIRRVLTPTTGSITITVF